MVPFLSKVRGVRFNDHTGTDKIGGIGTIVKIDESMFGKHKNHVSRVTQGKWVIGGVDRDTDNNYALGHGE